MRFAHGLVFAILSFFMWIVFSLFYALTEAELWGILMYLSFFGMFLFPLYYWLIEPMIKKDQPKVYPGYQQQYTPPVQPPPGKFCVHCGAPLEPPFKFCTGCGQSQ